MENLARIASFCSWNHSIPAVSLANAGFTCENDTIVCKKCHVVIEAKNLKRGEKFAKYHKSGCDFKPPETVPKPPETVPKPPETTVQILPAAVINRPEVTLGSANLLTVAGRLSTFNKGWPSFFEPLEMAECGFFFTVPVD